MQRLLLCVTLVLITRTRTGCSRKTRHGSNAASLMRTGMARLDEDRLEEALAIFNTAVKATPTYAAAGRYKAITEEQMARFDEALSSTDAVLSSNPGDADALALKGRLLERSHRYGEATIWLRSAVAAATSSSRNKETSRSSVQELHGLLCSSLHAAARPGGDLAPKTGAHRSLLQEAVSSCDAVIAAPDDSTALQVRSLRTKAFSLSLLDRHAEARICNAAALDAMPSHRSLDDLLDEAESDNDIPRQASLHTLWSDATAPNTEALWVGEHGAPVWISSAIGPTVHKLNRGLEHVVHSIIDHDPVGVKRSNFGGWQSSTNATAAFLNQDHFASVRRLKLHIMRETKDFLTALKFPFGEMVAKVSLFESWANANKNGDLNLPHSHTPCAIAGVYYIRSGFLQPGTKGANESGVHFLKPETSDSDILDNVVMATKLDENGRTLPYIAAYDGHWTSEKLGKSGTMALWPGRLRHWVPPHSGDDLRVTIAFNIELTLAHAR